MRLAGSLVLVLALWSVLAAGLVAQQFVTLGGETDDYLKLLALSGKLENDPVAFRSPGRLLWVEADSGHLWSGKLPIARRAPNPHLPRASLFPTELNVWYSSNFPRTLNDGAVWVGRGLTASLSAGGEVRWRFLTAILYPTVYWSENRGFPLAPAASGTGSRFAYPWQGNIDLPQRFGDASFADFDWGQSGLRLDVGPLTAGFSWENMWWGPARRNPLIMSNTAAGFPHLDLGTRTALPLGIGDLEFRGVWGRLAESPYFDTSAADDRRFFAGAVLGYRPSFAPELSVALARILYRNWPTHGLSVSDWLGFLAPVFNPGRVLPDGSVVNDSADGIVSISLAWTLPAAGFKAYLEWARNDFAGSLRDFLVEPDHTRGYTAGFEKLFPVASGAWRLSAETTTLGTTKTGFYRAGGSFYVHGMAPQGYTQRGQLVGAWIGPGGNSQFLGLDRYSKGGRWSIFLERVRYDDDFFFSLPSVSYRYEYHQVDLTMGLGMTRFWGTLLTRTELDVTRRLNRYFERGQDETNIRLKLGFSWSRIRGLLDSRVSSR